MKHHQLQFCAFFAVIILAETEIFGVRASSSDNQHNCTPVLECVRGESNYSLQLRQCFGKDYSIKVVFTGNYKEYNLFLVVSNHTWCTAATKLNSEIARAGLQEIKDSCNVAQVSPFNSTKKQYRKLPRGSSSDNDSNDESSEDTDNESNDESSGDTDNASKDESSGVPGHDSKDESPDESSGVPGSTQIKSRLNGMNGFSLEWRNFFLEQYNGVLISIAIQDASLIESCLVFRSNQSNEGRCVCSQQELIGAQRAKPTFSQPIREERAPQTTACLVFAGLLCEALIWAVLYCVFRNRSSAKFRVEYFATNPNYEGSPQLPNIPDPPAINDGRDDTYQPLVINARYAGVIVEYRKLTGAQRDGNKLRVKILEDGDKNPSEYEELDRGEGRGVLGTNYQSLVTGNDLEGGVDGSEPPDLGARRVSLEESDYDEPEGILYCHSPEDPPHFTQKGARESPLRIIRPFNNTGELRGPFYGKVPGDAHCYVSEGPDDITETEPGSVTHSEYDVLSGTLPGTLNEACPESAPGARRVSLEESDYDEPEGILYCHSPEDPPHFTQKGARESPLRIIRPFNNTGELRGPFYGKVPGDAHCYVSEGPDDITETEPGSVTHSEYDVLSGTLPGTLNEACPESAPGEDSTIEPIYYVLEDPGP